VEGSRQALRVTLYLDSCHFSELPTRLQNGGSLKLQTVLFTRGKTGLQGGDKEVLHYTTRASRHGGSFFKIQHLFNNIYIYIFFFIILASAIT